MQKRIMLTFRGISISCVVTSKIFARLSVTTIRRSSSTLIMPWLMQSVPKHGTILGDLTGQRPTAYPKARTDAEQAVAIAPELAEARAALGWVRLFGDWNLLKVLTS